MFGCLKGAQERGHADPLAQVGTSSAHAALLSDGLNCDRHPLRAIRSLREEVLISKDDAL
jgi:hypothetical protein